MLQVIPTEIDLNWSKLIMFPIVTPTIMFNALLGALFTNDFEIF